MDKPKTDYTIENKSIIPCIFSWDNVANVHQLLLCTDVDKYRIVDINENRLIGLIFETEEQALGWIKRVNRYKYE